MKTLWLVVPHVSLVAVIALIGLIRLKLAELEVARLALQVALKEVAARDCVMPFASSPAPAGEVSHG